MRFINKAFAHFSWLGMKPVVLAWSLFCSIFIWIVSWQIYFFIEGTNSCNNFGGDKSLIACSFDQLAMGSFVGAVRATIVHGDIFISLLIVVLMFVGFFCRYKQTHS